MVTSEDPGDSFDRTLADWGRALAAIKPDAVVLLLPETGEQARKPHSSWSPRCEAETLALLAAGQAGIPSLKVPRATVRAQLGCGKLTDEVKTEPAQGKYWAQRALGLFAARAFATSADNQGWPEQLPVGTVRSEVFGDASAR